MFDAIIVGARCAGSPLAMLLSRRGCRVLLVDKAKFPSDTVSTHLLWQSGLARAKRWGLLERIVALGAPPIRTVRFDGGDFAIAGNPPAMDGIDYAVAPRRILLDKMLVDAAVEAGAELREGCYVSEVVTENGRVTGIRGHGADGAELDESAAIVIGADGAHSMVAHAVRAAKYNVRPSTATGYYAYWRGAPAPTDFEIYMRAGWGGAIFPTSHGQTCLVTSWTDAFLPPASAPEEGYRRAIAGVPRLAEFVARAEQAEPLTGMRDLPGFFRKSWGDGWALAGDAGYHKHPLSAQGITDAFRDADVLSEAVYDGLSGRRSFAEALADYERRRDEAVLPMYESTCARALLDGLPPEVVALFRALQYDQPEADRFFGTDAGTVPIDEFFRPENVQRIIGSASAGAATS